MSLPIEPFADQPQSVPAAVRRLDVPGKGNLPDQLLRTRDVVLIARHHRCTLYRWMKAGTFPRRHKKGWRRSEIERWLAEDPAPPSPAKS